MDNVIRKFKPSPNEKTDSVCAKMLSEIMIFFVSSMLIIRDLLLIVFGVTMTPKRRLLHSSLFVALVNRCW